MRSIILFYSIGLASAVWIPRYNPCQLDNTQCEIADFKVGENETTCHTVSRSAYNWPKKSCIDFVQSCENTETLAEKIYHRIDCTLITDADVKLECEKWKVMQYCEWDILNMVGGFLVFVVLVMLALYCICGVGNKTNEELKNEEMEEEKKLLSTLNLPQAKYKDREKRFFN